jgi:putative cell wall-binding protein
VAFLLVTPNPASAAPATADVDVTPYIVGGHAALPTAWPWNAALLKAFGNQYGAYCSGALIAASWVLTAGHCIADVGKPDAVVIGRNDATKDTGDWNTADLIVLHPTFSNDVVPHDDVALVHLTHPSPQPAIGLIDGQTSLATPGVTATVVGWGLTDNADQNSEATNLQQLELPIQPDDACQQVLGSAYVASQMLCGGVPGSSPCSGDSGGPLMVSDGKGGWLEAGVVSWGASNCGDLPSVYARLATYSTWIESVTGPTGLKLGAGTVTRQAGADRYETAAAVSDAAFHAPVPIAFVATGVDFPDALAGGPAAATLGGPVLLTEPDALDPATKAELQRLRPAEIAVLGGTRAVSDAVLDALKPLARTSVMRLAGPDRFSTAAAISQLAFQPGVDTVFIATGTTFPDALAGSAAAATAHLPVELVLPNLIPDVTANELKRLQPRHVIVLGGQAAVSDAVMTELGQLTAAPVTRVAGADRYETAAALSASRFGGHGGTAFVATGLNFPDALAAGPAAGVDHAPLLLVPGTCVPAAVGTEVDRLAPSSVVLVGGTGVVSDTVTHAQPC